MSELSLDDVFVQPDIRRNRVGVVFSGGVSGAVRLAVEELGASISCPADTVAAGEPLFIDLPETVLWSPLSPTLYKLSITFEDDTPACRIAFGMREFSVKDLRFYLNGRPLYVRARLFDPSEPADPAGMERMLAEIRGCGFNAVRIPAGHASPQLAEIADRLGLLIFQRLPDPGTGEVGAEFLDTVRRLRSHASVVTWEVPVSLSDEETLPEGWPEVVRVLRALDSTRLCLYGNGSNREPGQEARYQRPFRPELIPYDDLRMPNAIPADLDMQNYLRHNGNPGRLVWASYVGVPESGSTGSIDHGTPIDDSFLSVFKGLEQFRALSNEIQAENDRIVIAALRANLKLAGYCFGRHPEVPPSPPQQKALSNTQKPLFPIVQMGQYVLRARQEVPLTVILANDDKSEARVELSLQVVGPTQQVLWKKKRKMKLPKHGKPIWSGEIAASGSAGRHQFIVRIMENRRIVAENSAIFYVVAAEKEPQTYDIHLLARKGLSVPEGLAVRRESALAPIHVAPPPGNTVRAYPENEMAQTLAQVRDGAVAVFLGPPPDWDDLAEAVDPALRLDPRNVVDLEKSALHYVRLHPLFEGLPTRTLMGQQYRSIAPYRSFVRASDEDAAGTVAWRGDLPIRLGNDVLVKRYGAGRLVFTHLRIWENLKDDPMAQRVFVNLLHHCSRRSVPSGELRPPNKGLVEWLREEKVSHSRRWMVAGPFANWNGTGHETSYPPEAEVHLDSEYPGWYSVIGWRPWYTLERDFHELDFVGALAPLPGMHVSDDYGTMYAYAEFNCDMRQEADWQLKSCAGIKAWFNGSLAMDSNEAGSGAWFEKEARVLVKQGRNRVLVKCTKTPGPCAFRSEFKDRRGKVLAINWWR